MKRAFLKSSLDMFIDFRERGRERGSEKEKVRETNIDLLGKYQCKRKTSIGCFLYAPRMGIKPATWVCALIGNGTHNILVYGTVLQSSESPGQGNSMLFKTNFKTIHMYIL